jgi:hemerythrin-like domain-containing protein
MTMRQNNWTLGTFCESYCRVVTVHHTIEDQSLFPYLRHHDPRLGPVIDRLQAEHRVIHDVLDGVDRALVAFISATDQGAALANLRSAADLLSDSLRSHLSYEERELVEPIARLGFA